MRSNTRFVIVIIRLYNRRSDNKNKINLRQQMKTPFGYILNFFYFLSQGIEKTLGKDNASSLYMILNVVLLMSASIFARINAGTFTSTQGQFWRGFFHVFLTA